MKEQAKKRKIEEFYQGHLAPFGDKLRGLCPFHNDDKNPNFFIYTKTNSWYCFREGIGGDSIAFYMRRYNKDFKDAIKEMAR